MPDDKNRGLYNKYKVEREDGQPVGQCIVLELDDLKTHPAVVALAGSVLAHGYQELSDDLMALVREYEP